MFEKRTINALKWIVGILDNKKIPFQISGGFVAKLYGSNRMINDIDIDVPESEFKSIEEEVKPYIIFGPMHINDGKWDMEIMTLKYEDQEIDIGGAYDTKISNNDRTKWIPFPVDYSKIRRLKIQDVEVNIVSPEELIKYKQHLDGKHQVEDIEAVRNYIKHTIL